VQLLRVLRVGKVLRMLRVYRLLRVRRLPRLLEKLEFYLDKGILQVRHCGATPRLLGAPGCCFTFVLVWRLGSRLCAAFV
jgi:hypothetical protein